MSALRNRVSSAVLSVVVVAVLSVVACQQSPVAVQSNPNPICYFSHGVWLCTE